MTELLMVMQELAANGCGTGIAWYLIVTEVFGNIDIVRHRTEELHSQHPIHQSL